VTEWIQTPQTLSVRAGGVCVGVCGCVWVGVVFAHLGEREHGGTLPARDGGEARLDALNSTHARAEGLRHTPPRRV
jgi:hypothetical protein